MEDSSANGADGSGYFVVRVGSFALDSYQAGEVSERWKATSISLTSRARLFPRSEQQWPKAVCVEVKSDGLSVSPAVSFYSSVCASI